MRTLEFIDAMTEMLGAKTLQGTDAVAISAENRQFLRKLYAQAPQGGTSQPARPTPDRPTFTPRQAAPAGQPVVQEKRPEQPPRVQQPKPSIQVPSVASTPATFTPTPVAATDGMDWAALEQAAKGCRACSLCQGRNSVVFEDGSHSAELMFIGGAPSDLEDAQGVPFVDDAGKLLTKIIGAMGFSRKDVYVANVLKCMPPENRGPKKDEVDACLRFVKRQIQLVQPKAIILLGAVPLQYMLGQRGIAGNRGKWMSFEGIPVMPTYHPAFLLRKPDHKREVWEDVQLVMQRFGIQPPSKPGQ